MLNYQRVDTVVFFFGSVFHHHKKGIVFWGYNIHHGEITQKRKSNGVVTPPTNWDKVRTMGSHVLGSLESQFRSSKEFHRGYLMKAKLERSFHVFYINISAIFINNHE